MIFGSAEKYYEHYFCNNITCHVRCDKMKDIRFWRSDILLCV